jgi:hypothetical protein
LKCGRRPFGEMLKLKEKDIANMWAAYVTDYDEELFVIAEGTEGAKAFSFLRPMYPAERLEYYRTEMDWKVKNGKI